jgi:hypothetical protein
MCRIPHSHKLDADHPNQIWKSYEMGTFHPDDVAAEGTAGSVLLFDCRLYHTKVPNDTDSERLAVQVRRDLTAFLLYLAVTIGRRFSCDLSVAISRSFSAQVRYGAGWYYTRLNHSGYGGSDGPPLQEEVLAQIPESVCHRFAGY